MKSAVENPRLAFLAGGGEMGERMRRFDWSRTPLGAPAGWPQPLKALVGLMLASEQPMFMAWGEGQTWLYNDAFIPIMGTKHPERLGCHALGEVWNEARAVLEPLFARVFAGEPVRMQDFGLMLDRHGRLEEAHFAFSYTPVRDETGRVSGLFGACIEITERVLADRRRAAEQEQQRRMFEQAPSFMCILRGPQHVFEFVNNAHKRLFNSAGWIGKPVREAFPELAGQGYFELLDQVYASGRRYVAQSAPVRYRRTPDGPVEERLLDFIYEPMLGDGGEVTGIFCEGFDVTDARRAEFALRESEAQLREADRRKDAFLATLAHELRNPLAPIRHAVRIARADNVEPQQLAWTLDVIDRQSGRMALLLDDLLDMSRITHGQLTLRTARVALEAILDSAVETARPLLEARSHVLERLAPAEVVVEADELRLSQVVSNLLTNAAKYTDPGGRITLGARREGTTLQIHVRDSGVGIDPATLPRLFQMFSQASDALEHDARGLGIGLALVKGLVTLHGGTVEARSAGVGQGSEFVVTLPGIIIDGEEPAPVAATPFALSLPERKRILVADDNVEAGATLKLLLELEGHDVQLVHDGEQALLAIESAAPDLVVLDIGMPKLDGYEAARRIRASGRAVRLVALTGWGQPRDRERAALAGFDAHLSKPVDYDALRRVLTDNRSVRQGS